MINANETENSARIERVVQRTCIVLPRFFSTRSFKRRLAQLLVMVVAVTTACSPVIQTDQVAKHQIASETKDEFVIHMNSAPQDSIGDISRKLETLSDGQKLAENARTPQQVDDSPSSPYLFDIVEDVELIDSQVMALASAETELESLSDAVNSGLVVEPAELDGGTTSIGSESSPYGSAGAGVLAEIGGSDSAGETDPAVTLGPLVSAGFVSAGSSDGGSSDEGHEDGIEDGTDDQDSSDGSPAETGLGPSDDGGIPPSDEESGASNSSEIEAMESIENVTPDADDDDGGESTEDSGSGDSRSGDGGDGGAVGDEADENDESSEDSTTASSGNSHKAKSNDKTLNAITKDAGDGDDDDDDGDEDGASDEESSEESTSGESGESGKSKDPRRAKGNEKKHGDTDLADDDVVDGTFIFATGHGAKFEYSEKDESGEKKVRGKFDERKGKRADKKGGK